MIEEVASKGSRLTSTSGAGIETIYMDKLDGHIGQHLVNVHTAQVYIGFARTIRLSFFCQN